MSRWARSSSRWSPNIILMPILPQNKQIGNFQFLIKVMSWKNLSMATSQNTNFYSLIGLVFYLNDHQTLLQGPFIQKQRKIKFPFFCPKSWVRIEKMSMWRLFKIDFLSSTRAWFLTKWSSDIISRPNLSKNKQCKISDFGPNSWVNPFKKIQYGDYVKWVFL